ncbi:MAG: aminotransferase class V-fold PLP-dependent enzyme [Candidatus Dadabacteria bacterium]|nr:MAG: aminotransferase class V-fold PLP-dependent enzyme [Candidatus Dadabacteria bacterium]
MNPSRYFDHAATSFPKHAAVVDAMVAHLRERAGNPGRGSYPLAAAAAGEIVQARLIAASLFDADAERVLLLPSATHALNLAITGTLKPGDRVVTTSIEHNALARPLARAADQGVTVDVIEAQSDGRVDPDHFRRARGARLVAVTAGSNVLGARLDLKAIRAAIGPEPLLCVDAAQTAGVLPLRLGDAAIDLLAIPGHKSLGGPSGTGLLCCSARVELEPLIEGGTGGNSEPRRTPPLFPDGFEAGTPNGPGIAGLLAALELVDDRGLPERFAERMALWQELVEGLRSITGLIIRSCTDPEIALPLVSFEHPASTPGELAWRLGEAGFAVRAGLHCAPGAHRAAGTIDRGLVRASLGPAHTREDIEAFVNAVRQVVS